jgi:hypothetical protein
MWNRRPKLEEFTFAGVRVVSVEFTPNRVLLYFQVRTFG